MSTINNQVNPYPFEPTKPYSQSAMRHYDNLPPLTKKRIDRDRTQANNETVDARYLEALHQAQAQVNLGRDEYIEGAY